MCSSQASLRQNWKSGKKTPHQLGFPEQLRDDSKGHATFESVWIEMVSKVDIYLSVLGTHVLN